MKIEERDKELSQISLIMDLTKKAGVCVHSDPRGPCWDTLKVSRVSKRGTCHTFCYVCKKVFQ